ncbi:hypothetical protein U9M48_010527 [Paspalum notatum var. saurae]|uniref:Uncharacterized protein n=1 Tax=Paspalum notatum var. saurae TaxID=547442 RepID=A0AAQ3STM5_PASNO
MRARSPFSLPLCFPAADDRARAAPPLGRSSSGASPATTIDPPGVCTHVRRCWVLLHCRRLRSRPQPQLREQQQQQQRGRRRRQWWRHDVREGGAGQRDVRARGQVRPQEPGRAAGEDAVSCLAGAPAVAAVGVAAARGPAARVGDRPRQARHPEPDRARHLRRRLPRHLRRPRRRSESAGLGARRAGHGGEAPRGVREGGGRLAEARPSQRHKVRGRVDGDVPAEDPQEGLGLLRRRRRRAERVLRRGGGVPARRHAEDAAVQPPGQEAVLQEGRPARARSRKRAELPALEEDHAPGREGGEHAAGPEAEAEDRRLRGGARGGASEQRGDGADGHAGVHGAGGAAGEALRPQVRRLQLRHPAVGDLLLRHGLRQPQPRRHLLPCRQAGQPAGHPAVVPSGAVGHHDAVLGPETGQPAGDVGGGGVAGEDRHQQRQGRHDADTRPRRRAAGLLLLRLQPQQRLASSHQLT